MKIIHLISGGDVGGAKTHVLSLLQGLGKTQAVRLVCFTGGAFAEEAAQMGIDTLVMDCGVFHAVQRLGRMIATDGFEVVHCHGARANMIGSILRSMIRVPIVTTVHSDYRLDYLGRPLHRLTYGTINTVALRMFDYHIGVSDAVAQMLISRRFDAQTMFSIYNGVDFTPVTPQLSREAFLESVGLTLEEDSVVFGIAARLNPVKDIGMLIRAFSIAQKKQPSIRLVIAGDGEEREKLETLAAQLCMPGSYAFAGWISDTDSFYNAIDVNTLSSLSEAFPYALPEGARMHCATIATAVGGVPYIIEHGITGLLTQPKDAETFAGHMVNLAANTTYRLRLAENLHQRAAKLLSIEATVSHQIEIYETILRRANAPKQKRNGVLICGAYGKGNAGDDAILKSIVRQMKHIDQDMPIYVLSHNPIQTRQRYYVGAVYAFNPFGCWHIMRHTKLFLSGGGSLIQDKTSTRSLWYYLWCIRLAKLAGNRVLMYGCGIGPVDGIRNRRMAAKIMNRSVDAITLREDMSLEELRDMGVTKPDIHITADPALLLQPGEDGAVESFLQSMGLNPDGAYALYVLRPWDGFDQKKQSICEAIKRIEARHGLTPVFFALEPERDIAPCREVADLLGENSVLISAPKDEKLLIGMMRKMRVVVSMRLHTLIFASSVGARLAAISYDPKVTGFMRYIGQKHCLAFDDVTAERLTAVIEETLQDTEPYCVEHLRALADENEEVARRLMEEST